MEPETNPADRGARRWILGAECAVLYVVGPALFVGLRAHPRALFPALWVWALVCLIGLLRDPGFDRRQLWNAQGLRREIGPMLARFCVLGGAIVAFVLLVTPDRAFSLPRRNPELWLMIMIGYPLVSVYPQEVIFRAWFFRRYATLFPGPWPLITASAAAFGYVHIVFENPIAVTMTLVGGFMFAFTYARSRSVLAASIEHALYGCLVFTIGLGEFFYSGAVNR